MTAAMINRKDTPAPMMGRPPKRHDSLGSPPHTPIRKSRTTGRHASKPHSSRQTPREASVGLADGVTARGGGEQTRNERYERISHDLSLTDNGRHSIVDNMLMSLNPDQPALYTAYADDATDSTKADVYQREQLPSSSANPEYTFPSDATSNRYSNQSSRGRRSNSSSNFHSALSRIESVPKKATESTRAQVYQAQRSGAGDRSSIPPSRGGRKSSKSSGSSSVDFGQMMGHRWQYAMGRRSSSFDHGQSSRGTHTASSSASMRMPMVQSLSQSHVYDNIEAAPMPFVPVGPRSRDRSPAHPPHPTHAPPQAPAVVSKSSGKSSRGKRDKGELRKLENRTANTNAVPDLQNEPQRPQSPPFVIPRAVSPCSNPQGAQSASAQSSISIPKGQPRDRPGFFRRVFGSSKNSASASNELLLQDQQLQSSARSDSQGRYTSSHKIIHGTQPQPAKENVPPALVKKPSSFFRRRKKSVSEHAPPPVLPLHLYSHYTNDSNDGSADRALETSSSVSSLRKIMTPYLNNSQQYPDGRRPSASNEIDTMDLPVSGALAESTIRLVSKHPRGVLDPQGNLASQDSSRHQPQPERESARANSNSEDKLLVMHNDSFLNDSSSTETRPVGSGEKAEPTITSSSTLKRTAARFPADMELRNDKENVAVASPKYHEEKSIQRTAQSPRNPKNSSVKGDNVPLKSVPKRLDSKNWLTPASVTPTKIKPSPPGSAGSSRRVWLEPADSDEDLKKLDSLSLPLEGAQVSPVSPVSDYQSASSTQPVRRASVGDDAPISPLQATSNAGSPATDITIPTEDDRILARRVYDGDETLVTRSKATGWLGDAGPERIRVRRAYMELFEWQSLSILAALRGLCGKLLLKGETQQVDRILDVFSARWCACNPNHGFKATDVVHTICYSILMLNTDLHLAEIEQKMTRTQFIKNTLPTIRRVATDAAPDGFETNRASTLPAKSWRDSTLAQATSPTFPSESQEGRRSFEGRRPSWRLSSRPSDQATQSYLSYNTPTALDYDTSIDDCGPLVKAPFNGKLSTWEFQVEIVLKGFFNSIRQERLPLYGSEQQETVPDQKPPSNAFSTMTGNMLRRTPSVLSKAGSESQTYRGRTAENRLGTGRWASKPRSRPRLYPASTIGSSRTSLEDQSSVWSPSVSSTWSKYSLGKTQTSMSIDSFASEYPQGDYKQSIGFANALSQAIIREEAAAAEPAEESMRVAPLLDDETLELAGAPWAKEGILKHKHHLEAVGKRSKDRNWVESFAVIEKGWMRLFSFSINAKSLRQKAKNQKASGGVVGGGNWADSAEALEKFLLRHTIASALPPPGYSKNRPHVWALSLPTGAVHLFQVGTPEIVKEFVTTANYWSARLSKEPLVGGVSNIEYGWSDAVINSALVPLENMPSSAGLPGPRPSLQSSIRSSIDQGSFRPKLPGDKILISDWTPPQQSMVASVLMEVDQLKALLAYVKNIENELQKHNELRGAMLLAVSWLLPTGRPMLTLVQFSSRHPNSAKAMANWERKSSYLLHEIVKFRTYIDCLQAAQAQKEKIYAIRAPAEEAKGRGEEQGTSAEATAA